MLIVFFEEHSFYLLFESVYAVASRSSSVNSSFHRRGPTTAYAFSECLFEMAPQVSSLYVMRGLN